MSITITNPDAYNMGASTKSVVIEVVVNLDPFEGAWHQPEDIMNWMCSHSYVQSVTLKGNKS